MFYIQKLAVVYALYWHLGDGCVTVCALQLQIVAHTSAAHLTLMFAGVGRAQK